MATFALTPHFAGFFRRLNPSQSYEQTASREYATVKGLIEDPKGLASELSPICFLQGSYRQETAIYAINDVDIVALCQLWNPVSPSGAGGGPGWNRNRIFDTVAAPLFDDARYRHKVAYNSGSICIKVDLGIKLEILPVVYKHGNSDSGEEPFRLWQPERSQWEDGYARYHQWYLSQKNAPERTAGNFKPAIKVLKHLRSYFGLDAVSFHIECLLYRISDAVFLGGPAEYIPAVLGVIAARGAEDWWQQRVLTPCGERDIFVGDEWNLASWSHFHELVRKWAQLAATASARRFEPEAIQFWQALLGKDFFPANPQ